MNLVKTAKKAIFLSIGGMFIVSYTKDLKEAFNTTLKLSAEDKALIKQELNDYFAEKGTEYKEKITETLKKVGMNTSEKAKDAISDTVKSIGKEIEKDTGVTFEEASVVRVVDGDTLVLTIEGEDKKVRLIGVDTPESVARAEYLKRTGKKNTIEGIEASDFTKNLLKGVDKVYLQRDKKLVKFLSCSFSIGSEKP